MVLSGTGSDGANGLRTVQEMAGLTIVQSVESAQFDGMPRNAIATGAVDYVLSTAAIAHLLREHARSPVVPSKAIPIDNAEELSAIESIFSLLSEEFQIDFSHYKPTTVSRRIDRRVKMTRYSGVRQYAEVLKNDPEELSNLYYDLLIGVTCFFRDGEAFNLLRREFDRWLGVYAESELEADSSQFPGTHQGPKTIRIWCAGCASGEERIRWRS